MADFTANKYIYLSVVTISDGTLSWNSASDHSATYTVTDVGADGVLTAGQDYWITSVFLYNGYTVNVNGKDYGIFVYSNNGYIPYNDSTDDLSSLVGTAGSTSSYQPALSTAANCFLTGTRIATPSGEVAVETLRTGDMVLTADGRAVPVRWLAKQTIANIPYALSPKLEPVRIAAGALGADLPETDLVVSADHGMILDGLVVNAGAMVNGSSIRFVPLSEMPASFIWWHIETEAHDVILANGAPSESFIDYTGRKAFDNYAEYLDLYGADHLIAEMPAPRVSAQRQLPASLRARLGIAVPEPDMTEIAHLIQAA